MSHEKRPFFAINLWPLNYLSPSKIEAPDDISYPKVRLLLVSVLSMHKLSFFPVLSMN